MPYTDSDPVTGGLTLEGNWIHDPLDAEGTIRQLRYGGASKTLDTDMMSAGQVYAGRTFPVFDFSEHQDDNLSVVVQVPFGDDWAVDMTALRTFAQARRVICFRDSRGRLLFGPMLDFSEADQMWGTEVSFTVQRADYTAVPV